MKHAALEFSGRWHWLLFGLALLVGYAGELTADDRVEFFEKHIRPALIQHCYECHSNARGKSEGELLLDSRPAMKLGGESGKIIEAGRPDESLLIEAIRYESLEMPPGKQLDDKTIRLFEEWIRRGAIDPRDTPTVPGRPAGMDLEEAQNFWAFRPRAKVSVPDLRNFSEIASEFHSPSGESSLSEERGEPSPAVQTSDPPASGRINQERSNEVVSKQFVKTDWGSSAMDRFILEKLQEKELEPVDEADRATWLRRVTFDLIGLPPTVQQLGEFVADQRTDAYERVVDRLLASPHYGERWGRYWLDLARYADTNGADENHKYPFAWRYRDYVVSAFNRDKPYDRMVQEQLAGDLLPAEDEAERRENLTATGFLMLGPKMLAEQDKEKLVADIVDEQLDTFGKVFLGLTLGCARCHDHKFDPITAEDYYALAGVFHSTKTMEHLNHVSQWNERELPDRICEQEIAENRGHLDRAKAHADDLDVELRDLEFDRKLQILSLLMIKEIGGAEASGIEDPSEESREETNDEPVSDAQSRPLEVFLTDNSGIFRVFDKLCQSTGEQFVNDAKRQWQALAAQTPDDSPLTASESFELRLASQPVPETQVDLVSTYIATLRQCRKEVKQDGADKNLWEFLFSRASVFDVTRAPALYVSASQKARLAEAKKRVDELTKALPALDKVMAADDSEVTLVALHVRGNHLQLSGDPLPREVPKVLESAGVPTEFPSNASGRLELAQWLTHPDHPLTARVMVNRIWQGHFGKGLVRSASNFGMRGQKPTHAELLDWLADEFIRSDWSIKRMHRMIVLSATYRLDGSAAPKAKLLDPENQLLSHFPRHRLELEPIRDSLIAIAGQLDHQLGGIATAMKDSSYQESGVGKTVFDAPRRTVYLPINRAALNSVFSTFDYVDPGVSLAQRPTTIVPHQTLFLMNHPLVMDAGRRLAEKVVTEAENSDARIELAYKSTFTRLPTPDERRIAKQFVSAQLRASNDAQESAPELAAWSSYCRSLLLTSEFLYVE